MKIIGLTGGIACGKSETTKYLRSQNIPVIDCDAISKQLQSTDADTLKQIQAILPEVIENGILNRKALSHIAFTNPKKLKLIEGIMMPKILQKIHSEINRLKNEQHSMIFIDAPLLFEKGLDKLCDYTICVYTHQYIQKRRFLSRPNMTEEKLKFILQKQMSLKEKRKRADFQILSDTLPSLHKQINAVIQNLSTSPKQLCSFTCQNLTISQDRHRVQ